MCEPSDLWSQNDSGAEAFSSAEPVPPKYQAPVLRVPAGSARPNSERLITEELARELTADGRREVCIEENAIITPLAWDVFVHNKIKVIRE